MSLFKHQFRNAFVLFMRKCSTEQQPVELQGWIQKVHKQGAISFIHLVSDVTAASVQVVVPKEICRTFSIGGAAKVSGKWVKSIGAGQEKEILADSFTLLHNNQLLPIRGDFSQVRNKLNIRPKHPAIATILQLRSKINSQTHKYFTDKGFCHIDTPFLSVNDCEGAGEIFTVRSCTDDDFFGPEPVYLPVSGQLHLEAVCGALPKVYTMNAAFRADKSLTRHHMAEFRMLEIECAFMDSLEDLCKLVEDYVKFMISVAKNECAEDLQKLKRVLAQADDYLSTDIIEKINLERPFLKIPYEEAASVLEQSGSKVVGGFNKKQELKLLKHYEGPVFVQRFPASQKPFYMRMNDKNQAECFDLLFPSVGELAGGSVREYDFDKLKTRNFSSNLDWYLQLRQMGYPRSSGFGLGLDRLMQCLFSIDNVRDTLPFPRWFKHCQC